MELVHVSRKLYPRRDRDTVNTLSSFWLNIISVPKRSNRRRFHHRCPSENARCGNDEQDLRDVRQAHWVAINSIMFAIEVVLFLMLLRQRELFRQFGRKDTIPVVGVEQGILIFVQFHKPGRDSFAFYREVVNREAPDVHIHFLNISFDPLP